MDEQAAREILKGRIQADGSITDPSRHFEHPAAPKLSWRLGNSVIYLIEGDYSADELEAIAWWMRYGASAKKKGLTDEE